MNPAALLLFVALLSPGLASCTDNPELPLQNEHPVIPTPDAPSNDNDNPDNNVPMSNKLIITIGNTSFGITLANNAATNAFKLLLPITLNMSDLNSNEKFYNLSTNLPTAASRPSTIHTGDLMLFGSNCLVIFYETFSTSYSYTPLGSVDNPSGLASALGSGNIIVKFHINNK